MSSMEELLTGSELAFLSRHGYGPDDIFDARGMAQAGWKRKAKQAGKSLALGNGCTNGGHRLKTRAGHCAQCDPRRLAFLERHSSVGWLYIAGSSDKQLIKIGTCTNRNQRCDRLCSTGYGGASDWKMLYWVWVAGAGALETSTLAKLYRYRVSHEYMKDGAIQSSYEMNTRPFAASSPRDGLPDIVARQTHN